ncbi:MAG: FliA/WhiG family RNA polymerase sigma factor [Lachnospiraceae bacterium]|nr:FliA/WhiG family RNA polymerase sigma factor [Lachnospiraceae bacterium]
MNENARAKLWEEYGKNRTPQLREKIIIEYAPLVKIVAGRLSMYLGYNVEYDDLCGYGVFGLIDAIDKYDPAKDVKFETYASLRIRGSILDQIRKMDWIPRTIRQKQKQIDDAVKAIEAETGQGASDADIARKLGLSDEEFADWQSQMAVTNVVSLNEFNENSSDEGSAERETIASSEPGPEDIVEQDELRKMLADSLELLTEKERKVILLYYYEELTLKEVSNVLEVSESRVSQLHIKALTKMKKKLGKYMGYLVNPNE